MGIDKNMEQRKIIEIEYYNREADSSSKESGGLMGFDPFLLLSYSFLHKLVKENCQGKRVLDFGCGTGLHLPFLSNIAREVVGIDLSEKSLEVSRAKNLPNVKLMIMDAERLEFPDASFDIVFDGGTFSSIDLDKALPEIIRVLRPGGALIGIETLGHNPFTNLKRLLNRKTGKRTEWAADHIVKQGDLRKIGKHLIKKEIRYFHVVSWMAFPFLNLPFGIVLLKTLERADKLLAFLNKYSFKAVFIYVKAPI